MAAAAAAAAGPATAEIYTYESAWPIYAANWSVRGGGVQGWGGVSARPNCPPPCAALSRNAGAATHNTQRSLLLRLCFAPCVVAEAVQAASRGASVFRARTPAFGLGGAALCSCWCHLGHATRRCAAGACTHRLCAVRCGVDQHVLTQRTPMLVGAPGQALPPGSGLLPGGVQQQG